MKITPVFLAALLATLPAFAQTNADTAPAPANAPSDAPPSGPVVMPPATATQPAPKPFTDSSTIPSTPVSPAPPAANPPSPADAASLGSQIPGANPSGNKEEDIYDIRPPFFFLISWWPWILAALGTLLSIGLFFLLLRLFRDRGMSPKTAYDLAMDKLAQARGLLREDEPAPYAVAVSETIRTYLGQRFGLASSRRTTEEFLRQMESDPNTPLAEHRDLLGAFLRACDLVKFARYQPTMAELEQVHERAVAFVQATRPVTNEAQSGLAPAPATP